jgi:ATP phosphoribosyltransferase
MKEVKLTIGMPAGSLANPKRGGNLVQLLQNAGFRTQGYETGGPTLFNTVNFFFGWDGRPQEFGCQLGLNELDIAIAGDDWIKERSLELAIAYNTGINLEKVLSLNRGDVRIVAIVDGNTSAVTAEEFLLNLTETKERITLVSEMPYLALDWVGSILKTLNLYERYKNYTVQKYKTPSKIKQGILIYETWGKTEAKVKNEGADIGVEISQTGSSIKNYGLKIIDTLMESETGIWINPDVKRNKQKSELLKMFLLNIYGAVNAENKVLLLFNVPNSNTAEIEKYLTENNLFGDEPTKNVGALYTEYSIQVNTADPQVPLAQIRYELAKRKAKSIDTVPITSSIKSIEMAGF